MPVTYDPALRSDKDWVRMLVGDRDVARASLDDQEILAVLATEPNRYLAAAQLGEIILSKNGDEVMKQVGDLRIQWNGTPQSGYRAYLKTLRERGARDTLQVSRRSFRVL